MSHFSVLVFTQGKPSDDELATIMMPWHRFESTGYDNEYVVEVDTTEEMKTEFLAVKASDQMSFLDWLEENTGIVTLIDGALPDLEDPDEHKYGYILVGQKGDVLKIIKRTNPNTKWDWYQVGGRFTGLLSGYDPRKDPRNQETCSFCEGTGKQKNPAYNCNVCQGKGRSLKFESHWINEGNQLAINAIDWVTLKNMHVQTRLKNWASLKARYEENPIPNMDFIAVRKAWAALKAHSQLAREGGDERPLYDIIAADPLGEALRRANLGASMPDEVADGEGWAQIRAARFCIPIADHFGTGCGREDRARCGRQEVASMLASDDRIGGDERSSGSASLVSKTA